MTLRNLLLVGAVVCGLGCVAQEIDQYVLENPCSVRAMLNGSTETKHFPNHFTVTPPEGFVIIDALNSKQFLVDMLGNSESSAADVIGCIIPDVKDMFEEQIPYFFVISDEMCGYVKDNDAASIDYDDLLKEMQQMAKEENEAYRKTHPNFPVVKLLGWSERPHYDKENHTLYWGKLLDFQENNKTVNYEMRVLGKDGLVMINAVGDEFAVLDLKKVGKQVLDGVSFDQGYAYSDFDESRDHVAEWTIGGLIAGKVLTKVGFWALIAKGWKFVAIAFVALLASIKKFFRRKNDDEDLEAAEA